jgi:hypothetical protein
MIRMRGSDVRLSVPPDIVLCIQLCDVTNEEAECQTNDFLRSVNNRGRQGR